MTQFEKLVRGIASGWQRGSLIPRIAIVAASVLILIYVLVSLFISLNIIDKSFDKITPIVIGVALGLIYVVATYERLLEDRVFKRKIESYERQIRANPRETKLAWELAQAKLESYLNRNLGQVRSIFWLTLLVMAVGFGFILWGVHRALDSPDKLPVAILASASGLVVNFIGGSFLLIYRAILGQSSEYVAVLERINAVGMAVQILETIPDESADLKNQTTSEIAKQLLLLYSPLAKKKQRSTSKAKST